MVFYDQEGHPGFLGSCFKRLTSLGLVLFVMVSGCAATGHQALFDPAVHGTADDNPVLALQGLLEGGNKIVLAVVLKSVTGPGIPRGLSSQDSREWVEKTREGLVTRVQRSFLEELGEYEGFRLVHWNMIRAVMEGASFRESGSVRDMDDVRVGQLLSATHLLMMHSRIYRGKNVLEGRLTDIKNARVISTFEEIEEGDGVRGLLGVFPRFSYEAFDEWTGEVMIGMLVIGIIAGAIYLGIESDKLFDLF